MTTRYLLECPCGRTVPVRTQQAGGTVACACGLPLQVPKLGELRKLPHAATDASPDPSTPWELSQGLAFSLGLLVLVVATAALTYLVIQDRKLLVDSAEYEAALQKVLDAENAASWDAAEAFEFWSLIRNLKLERRQTPMFEIHRQRRRQLRAMMVVAGVASAAGAAAVAWALLSRRRQPPGPPTVGSGN